YIKQKQITQDYIIKYFLEYFDFIKKEEIINIFSATSTTFNKYINRYNCGGKAITIKNILEVPSCKTPFKGLYNIGDTIFAGQGWPGVAIGVEVLNKELNV
ncbi:MAG: NAD(P)/FAD-dependent oxidoreductase, partial [Poseidonibacter sp.]